MAGVGAPPEAIAGMRRSPAWPLLESVAHTIAYDLTIMGDSKVPVARAATVKVPVLVIDGGDSPPWAGDAAGALAAALPDARRRTLPGQTHQVDVEVLAPVLAGFFGGAE